MRSGPARTSQGRKLPIFVGGTGLYFKALTEGLSDMPAVPDEVREQVRRESEGLETPELHGSWRNATRRRPATFGPPTGCASSARSKSSPPPASRSCPSTARGSRGLLPACRLIKLFLAPERDELRRRIDARFLAMMDKGALDEVRALGERNLDPMLPAMRAHGVPGLLAHLRGEIPLDEAIARGQGDTRRYAKRQFTWFRHQIAGLAMGDAGGRLRGRDGARSMTAGAPVNIW